MIKQVLICVFFIHINQAQTCDKGKHNLTRFGPSCEYMCHCEGHQCDMNTGECPENTECDPGWMGSGCQYANIAYNADVISNHLRNQQYIVDGNTSTCADPVDLSHGTADLLVNFSREIKVTEVHLLFLFKAPPFNISVLGTNEVNPCGSLTNTSGQKEFILKCRRPLYGQQIQVSLHTPDARIKLCELNVPAGRNMAYGKPAYQSSMFKSWYSSQAVDGIEFTCSHTQSSIDPWWLLDLEAPVMIQWFRIYNRKDTNRNDQLNERLRNFRILLSQDNETFTEHYHDQSVNPDLIITLGLKPDVMARFVKIDLQGNNHILTLCEVQVFGECKPGYYESHCNESCDYCKDGNCYTHTGSCRSCPPGRQGDFCQYACNDYYYGNCKTRCSHCRDSAVCDKVNGFCPSGLCFEGWHGDKCETMCNSTHYGPNCVHHCGYCLNGTCDRITGNCTEDADCQLGWQGPRCDISGTSGRENPADVSKNAGVLVGSVSTAVGVLVCTVVIIIVMVKNRRRRNKNETNTESVDTETHYVNFVSGNPAIKKTVSSRAEKTNTGSAVEGSSLQRGMATQETHNPSELKEPAVLVHNDYEKLQDLTGTAESAYSTIDHSLTDDMRSDDLERCSNYVQML